MRSPPTRREELAVESLGLSAHAYHARDDAGSLAALAVGESAVVKRIGNTRPVALRLMEMGLLPGTRVVLERVAPLGDPIVVRVRGYALSLRRDEARHVEITRSADT